MTSTRTIQALPPQTTSQGPLASVVPTLAPGSNVLTVLLPVVAFSGTPSFAATTEVVSGTTIFDIFCSGSDCQGTSEFQYTPIATDQFNWGYNTTTQVGSGALTSTITATNECTLLVTSAVCSLQTQAAATLASPGSIFGSGEAEQGTYALTSYIISLTGSGVPSSTTSGSGNSVSTSSSTTSSSSKPSTSSNNSGKRSVGALLSVALLAAAILA